MNLYEKLKLLDLLKDGTVRTYRALEPVSGGTVLLHWLPGTPGPEQEDLFRFLDTLPSEGRELILEAGVADARPYIITEAPIAFTGLREWLTQASAHKSDEIRNSFLQKGQWKVPDMPPPDGGPSTPDYRSDLFSVTQTVVYPAVSETTDPEPRVAPPPPAPPPPSTHHAEPGEFTRMFQAPPGILPPVNQSARSEPGEFTRMFQFEVPQSGTPAPPAEVAPPTHQAGEFTRMFQQPDAVVTSARPIGMTEPGEFTRMFQAPVPQPPSGQPAPPQPTPPAQPPSSQPGEFTRLFQSPAPQSVPAALNLPLSPQPPAHVQPGEFTRLFQSPLPSPPPPPSDDLFENPYPSAVPPRSSVEGEFTRVFGPFSGTPENKAPAPPPPAPPNPSETRLFSVSEVQDVPQMPYASTPAPQQDPVKPISAKSPSYAPLILIFAVLGLCALLLIFYFAKR